MTTKMKKVRLKTLDELKCNYKVSLFIHGNGDDWYRITDNDNYQSYDAKWFGLTYKIINKGLRSFYVSSDDGCNSFNITFGHGVEVEDYSLPEELFKI
jgi:hypothetical protein